jgi:hypothetical protein
MGGSPLAGTDAKTINIFNIKGVLKTHLEISKSPVLSFCEPRKNLRKRFPAGCRSGEEWRETGNAVTRRMKSR